MRCPVCFSRDVDVLLKHEPGPPQSYACLKCSFRGSRAEVYAAYRDIQKKFRFIDRRITIEDYDVL